MLVIRAIFDGKAFVPQQPIALPERAEAIVIVDQTDPAAQARLDDEVRAYYQSAPDGDDAWGDDDAAPTIRSPRLADRGQSGEFAKEVSALAPDGDR